MNKPYKSLILLSAMAPVALSSCLFWGPVDKLVHGSWDMDALTINGGTVTIIPTASNIIYDKDGDFTMALTISYYGTPYTYNFSGTWSEVDKDRIEMTIVTGGAAILTLDVTKTSSKQMELDGSDDSGDIWHFELTKQ